MSDPKIYAALISTAISTVVGIISFFVNRNLLNKDKLKAQVDIIQELAIKHWIGKHTAKELQKSCTEIQSKLHMLGAGMQPKLDSIWKCPHSKHTLKGALTKLRNEITFDFETSARLELPISDPKIEHIKAASAAFRKLL